MRPLLALLLLGVPVCASAQAVGLAADGGAPLERVAITRLPAVSDTLRVEVRAPGYDAYPALTDSTDDGRPAIVVPIHPDVLTGGPVTLAFFDGGRPLGEVAPFHVAPVPPAPGTLRRVVELQREALAAEAALYGFTLDALREPTPDLPVQLWPAAIALGALDDPRNPNALTAVLVGEAPAFQDVPFDLDVADAVAALLGLDDDLAESLRALDALGPPPEPVRFVEAVEDAGPFETSAPRGPVASVAARRASLVRIAITSPASLSYYMHLAEEHRRTAESLALKWAGEVNNLVGLVPHPAAKGASLAVGLALFAKVEAAALNARLLPSTLGSARASFSVIEFDEDFSARGQWSAFQVTARSGTWNAAETVAKVVAEAVVARRGLNGLRGPGASPGSAGDLFWGAADVHATNWAKSSFSEYVGAHARGAVVGPFTWGPFDITDAEWSRAETRALLGDDAFEIDAAARTYWPADVGRGAVKLSPRGDRFPPNVNEGRGAVIQRVEAEAILIGLDPSGAVVSPGSQVTITAAVRHAHDTTLRWETTAGTITPVSADAAVLQLPAEVGVMVEVTATSLAQTGLRDPKRSPEPRTGVGFYSTREDEEEKPEEEALPVGGCAYALGVTGDLRLADERDNAFAFMWNVPHDDGRYSFSADNAAFSLPRGYLFFAGLGDSDTPPVYGTGVYPLESATFQAIEGRTPGAVFEHNSVRPSPDPPVLIVTRYTSEWIEGEISGALVEWDREHNRPLRRIHVRAAFQQAHGSRPFACGGDAAIEEVIESPAAEGLLEGSPALQERLRDVLGRRRRSGQ